ncbi:MAG: TonB-dependent receptor [Proteobacteria bacterium]|nr:TonB-dependent receptor [Pseudomonadota bacterium]
MRLALLSSAGLVALAAPAMAAEADAAASSQKLDDIVVTANKRQESLQKVPIAITAIPAAQLQLRALSAVTDLSAIAPNVSVVPNTTSGTAAVVTIRGIPTSADETQGFDQPIGVYQDGVYLARSSAQGAAVADIERVEVLRGPQGTLFGRNTTGGALNIITRKPSATMGLKVEGTYGNYGLAAGKVIFDTGDIDGIRFTLGYGHDQRNGVTENPLVPGRSKDPGAHNNDSVRFAADYVSQDGNLEIYNVFDYSKVRTTAPVMQLAAVGNGTTPLTTVIDGHTFSNVVPANIAGFLAESTNLNPACPNAIGRTYQTTVCDPTQGQSVDKLLGDMLRVELKLGGVTLRSTSAYREWSNVIGKTDLDGLGPISAPLFVVGNPALPAKGAYIGIPASVLTGVGIPGVVANCLTTGTTGIAGVGIPGLCAAATPAAAPIGVPNASLPLFSADNNRGQNQFSQELELVSNSTGPFKWVLGSFYFKETGYETNNQSIGFVLDTNALVYSPSAVAAFLTGFGYPAASVAALAGTTAAPGSLTLALRAANPARYRLTPVASTLAYNANGESVAVYGQASYRPGGDAGRLGITFGLRYTWDKKGMIRTQNGATPFTGADIPVNVGSASFSAPTGNLAIDYRASDEVNLYARVARGYRSGGFNARAATSSTSTPPLALTPFNNEILWSYEAGAKMEFLHRFRLNVSGFYNEYTNQQVTVPVPIVGAGSFGTQTINAGKTTYTGFEVEGLAKITDYFTIDGNFGYIKIKLKEFNAFDDAGNTVNIASAVRPGAYAPKYTANIAGTLTYPIGSYKLTARVGYNYTSSFVEFGNTITAPFSYQSDADARGLVDAQFKLDGLLGGHAAVTLWGKNITNQHYVTRSVDFGQLGWATVIFGDPATYGVTVTTKF